MNAAKRLQIITAYDERFQEIGAIAEKSIRIYAGVHDADYHIYHDIPAERPPAWAKIKYLIEEVQRGIHEFILWIDADACFVRGDVDILSQINHDKEICVVNHRVPHSRIVEWPGAYVYRERPNTGVMLVRSSDWSLAFLRKIWDKTEYIDHPFWEQAAFHDLVGYWGEITLGSRQNEPNLATLAKIQWLPGEWNSVPTLIDGEPSAPAQNPIIVHFAGMPNEARRIEMNKLLFERIPLSNPRMPHDANARQVLGLPA